MATVTIRKNRHSIVAVAGFVPHNVACASQYRFLRTVIVSADKIIAGSQRLVSRSDEEMNV